MRAALTAIEPARRDPLDPDAVWLLLMLAADPGLLAVVDGGGALRASRPCPVPSGLGDMLPLAVRDLLAGSPVDAICCVTGPGSFTGIRAALALAHGLALGRDLPLIGVTRAEAATAGEGPVGVVAAARARHAGALPALAPLPFYDGPPRVTAPAVPPRPPPLA